MLNLKSSQYVSWCRQVIHHAASHAIDKKKRLGSHEVLLFNRFVGEEAVEWGDLQPSYEAQQAFYDVEWRIVFQALSATEELVITLSYVYGFTQQEIASRLHMPQQKVSVIRKRALRVLWTQWSDVECQKGK